MRTASVWNVSCRSPVGSSHSAPPHPAGMLRLAVRFFCHGFSAPLNANTAALTAPTVSRHLPPARVFDLCAANGPCTKAKSKQPEIQTVRVEMCCRQRSSDQLSLLMRVCFTNGEFFCRSANLCAFFRSIYTRPIVSPSEYVSVTSPCWCLRRRSSLSLVILRLSTTRSWRRSHGIRSFRSRCEFLGVYACGSASRMVTP